MSVGQQHEIEQRHQTLEVERNRLLGARCILGTGEHVIARAESLVVALVERNGNLIALLVAAQSLFVIGEVGVEVGGSRILRRPETGRGSGERSRRHRELFVVNIPFADNGCGRIVGRFDAVDADGVALLECGARRTGQGHDGRREADFRRESGAALLRHVVRLFTAGHCKRRYGEGRIKHYISCFHNVFV